MADQVPAHLERLRPIAPRVLQAIHVLRHFDPGIRAIDTERPEVRNIPLTERFRSLQDLRERIPARLEELIEAAELRPERLEVLRRLAEILSDRVQRRR